MSGTVVNPFREYIGAMVLGVRAGRASVVMPESSKVVNGLGVVHGGAICTLVDVAIGTAVRERLRPGDLISTLEMKVNFVGQGRGDLVADSRVEHLGRTTALGVAEVRDRAGTLIALGTATFYVRRGAGPARPGARTALIPEYDGPEPGEENDGENGTGTSVDGAGRL